MKFNAFIFAPFYYKNFGTCSCPYKNEKRIMIKGQKLCAKTFMV